ncbi:uncharacterized protein LOC143193836 [Rhynchophorus ferrugineus]|uniref:Uncharacterized protein n=1 Tax=Rhynchophorus ferrugineus TaxID=354439 RepID=A0A834MK55_RHYFE|nr:hypothetical protein GWI33_001233 [Rhynchophorus ferrugineus]
MYKIFVLVGCVVSAVIADASIGDVSTLPPPPLPYAFGYAAGRFPGHIDRTHSEVSDGSGVVQGSYSYVDPSYKIRKVDYVADQYGFHPVLNHEAPAVPQDTPIVAAAKEKHLAQYSRIADAHQHAPQVVIVPVDSQSVQYARDKHLSLFQKIADEHARIAAEREALKQAEEQAQHGNSIQY